ncbi:MAG: nucleotidyltransferase family protein [Endomicrobiia bacterium]
MKGILVRNILIHNEIKKIKQECCKNNIKLILLKGAALVELFPEYSFFRDMEDVDVLVEKKDFCKFLNILKYLGYELYYEDPNVVYKKDIDLKIDILTELWYLNNKENKKLINSCIEKEGLYFLPPKEMLRHIIIHSYIEHNYIEEKWLKDIMLIKEKFNIDFEMKNYIPKKFLIFVNKKIYYKGHFLQFLFLPFSKKISFLFKKFFPKIDFMIRRYAIKDIFALPFFYFYRWASFIVFFILSLNKKINLHEQEF